MRRNSLFLLLFCLSAFYACQNSSGEGTANEAQDAASQNQYMVELLAERHSIVNPLDMQYYYNSKRAATYDSLRRTQDPSSPDYSFLTYWYCRELLNSGLTEKAIDEIETVKNAVANEELEISDQEINFFNRLLAVAYLRLGEQENCIINHTSSSCIIPISADGVHTITRGSETAIEIIEPLLAETPNDLELKWLLNIAYQTLGKYPAEVPSDYLIPLDAFEDNSSGVIQRFPDIAPMAGVATRGLAGGSITEDFNNDGFLDILVTSSGFTASDQMRIYMNDGQGGFVDKTEDAGLMGLVGGLNCVQTDYNNDGFADVFVLRGGWFGKWGKHPNSLLRNNGDGTFTDVTKEAGLLSLNPTQTCVWADFNNDGWVDLFIGNETNVNPGNGQGINRNEVHQAEFYLNKKDGTFANIAPSIGFTFTKFIKGATAIDVNNDGLQDLFLSILGEPNKMMINKGNMQFEDRTRTARVFQPIVSFPVGSFDYNNDGFEDLVISGYSSTNNTLAFETAREFLGNDPQAALPKIYRNNGNGSFTDVTEELNMNVSIYGMGFNYGDLDNDGYLDIYFGTGDPSFESIIPNRMFRNVEGKYFEEVSFAGGFSNIQKGHGISWADLDRDGDQDIYITMGGAHEGDVYQNQLLLNPSQRNNWINLQLKGDSTNAKAIGTKVHILTSEGQDIYRTVSTGASFGGNSLDLEIGLGPAESITKLEIFWPVSQTEQVFENISANQFLEIIESQDTFRVRNLSPMPLKMNHHEGSSATE